MTTKENFSLEGLLSPSSLKSELSNQAEAIEFLDSFSGRKALLTLLYSYYNAARAKAQDLKTVIDAGINTTYDTSALQTDYEALTRAVTYFARCILAIDYNGVPEYDANTTKTTGTVRKFWEAAINGQKTPEKSAAVLAKFPGAEPTGFLDKIKGAFTGLVDSWRGYTPDEKKYSQADILLNQQIQKDMKYRDEHAAEINQNALAAARANSTPIVPAINMNQTESGSHSFSNYGVKNMKVNRTVRKTFSNDAACDMLANKLTRDWFICEPECQPLIAEQLKAACVPAASFAPALKCNVLQYDGEAKVSKSELAALDKVQQFVQALKDEIACGNDCGGIQLIPEAKAFSLKRQAKRQLKNFAEEGEIDIEEVNTPNEIIEAEEAGIDIAHPEMYEEVADKAEAGELPADLMGIAPAVTAPTSVDPASMGAAYNDVIDSTIADNSGIVQDDMSGYDAAPGELTLSAATVGDAMAKAQADAIVYDDADEAGALQSVAPVAPMANPQAFSRSLHRRQMGATAKNFANTRKPVQQKAQPAQNMKGLYRLLGDKYIR